MVYPVFPTTVIGPELGYTKTVEPRIKKVNFGDGYTQEVPDGINYMLAKWDLNWPTLTGTEKSTIEDFLVARKGCETFTWTTPSSETVIVKARSWKIGNPEPSIYSVEVTFEQVPI